jgi:two-component sensor histidine kinase
MSISSKSLLRSTSVSLLIGFIALMGIVAVNFWLGERAQSDFDDAISARDTRIAAVELRNAVQTAEASQRGFLLTGNEIYLAPYQAAKIQARRHLSALKVLLSAASTHDTVFTRLDAVLAAKFEELDRTIGLKRDKRDEEALSVVRTNSGKALTDEANVFFAGIIGRADEKLTAGVAEQRANTIWVRLVSGIGALIIVTVVGGAALGIAGYTRELRSTSDQLAALNDDLEERVKTRTQDLGQARDRAEVLLSEVNHRVANSLAMVSSLVSMQSRAVSDQVARDALVETQDRIFAISLVHKRLYSSSDARVVELKEYLTGLLDHLRTSMRSQAHGITLTSNIEPVALPTDVSVNLGVIVTELVTNAFKYAYPQGIGEVRVGLRVVDQFIELSVEDDGQGRDEAAPAKGTGVGTRIVNAMSGSLGSKVEYRPLNPGTAARLVFPATSPSVEAG